MSLSPSKMNARKPSQSVPSQSVPSEPLTLPQALLITAGLAGLVGLCGGAFLRFSLANSPNARFLTPLQTFPALANWTPDKTADSESLSGDLDEYGGRGDHADAEANRAESTILTFEPAAPIDSTKSSPIGDSLDTEITVDSEPTDTATFDAFAARGKGRQRTTDPLDLLKKGPDLGGLRPRSPRQIEGNSRYDENSQGDIYDDSDRYADDYDGYNNGDYNDGYQDNYYPSTDEPIDRSDAY